MANRRKRPWKVFSGGRTQAFSTQMSADKAAKRCRGMVHGPAVKGGYINYYFDDLGERVEMKHDR